MAVSNGGGGRRPPFGGIFVFFGDKIGIEIHLAGVSSFRGVIVRPRERVHGALNLVLVGQCMWPVTADKCCRDVLSEMALPSYYCTVSTESAVSSSFSSLVLCLPSLLRADV